MTALNSVLPIFEQKFGVPVRGWNPAKRLIVCIVPVSLLLAIPIIAAFLRDGEQPDGRPRHTIAGIDEKRFFIWIEATWLGYWVCRGVVHLSTVVKKSLLPKKQAEAPDLDHLLDRLAFPMALTAWAILNQIIFAVCINATRSWTKTAMSCLKAFMICTLIYLAKEVVIQRIRLSCEKRLFQKHIKSGVSLLCKMLTTAPVGAEEAGSKPITENTALIRILSAFENEHSTAALATELFESRIQKGNPSRLGVSGALWNRYGLRAGDSTIDRGEFESAVRLICKEYHDETDVVRAIDDLNGICWLVVLVLWVVTAVIFLTPSLVGAVATSATALLSLSFVIATTCQEVLGSCIFLFVKHPYDVGDLVVINTSELRVEHIALLYTVFVRIDSGVRTQTANNVLNELWVDNPARSQAIRERLSLRVAAHTTAAQIAQLQAIVKSKLNLEKQAELTVAAVNILDMQALELQCRLEYQLDLSSVETRVEDARDRILSDLMQAWITALRQVEIEAPAGVPLSANYAE